MVFQNLRFPFFGLAFFLILSLSGCATTPKTASLGPSSSLIAGQSGIYHTVQKGQTLYRISKMYNVEVSELMRLNQIYNASQVPKGTRLFIPTRQTTAPAPAVFASPGFEQAKRAVGPRKYTYPWRTITVHHSGTLQGSGALFDKDHRRRHMGGLFYHFVIGNGTKTPKGFIEVGWRWKNQVKANRPYDVQICLVGDFNKQKISNEQFNALVNLIRVIKDQYGIPMSSIRRHCDIPGKHTDCPGKTFPFSRLLSELSQT